MKTCFEQPPNDSIEEYDTPKKFNNEIVYADERYTVLLPWRVGSQFTINYSQLSLSRLHSVIKRLKRENNFDRYADVISSYESKGYIERREFNDEGCYLSHHCVLKFCQIYVGIIGLYKERKQLKESFHNVFVVKI